MVNRRQRRRPDGRWVVHRERCRLESSTPTPEPWAGDNMESIVPRLVEGLHLQERDWLAGLISEWATVVGDTVAKHTRPGQLRGRTLYVFVDSAVWLSELKRLGTTGMLQNLQSKFGANRVSELVLCPDPDPR